MFLSVIRFYFLHHFSYILQARLKFVLENRKRPKSSQMAKWFFGGQARKKEAKFELFGLQEANLATLFLYEII